MMNRLKRIWYRKRIECLKERVELTHYNFLCATKYEERVFDDWIRSATLYRKYGGKWLEFTSKNKRKELDEAKEWRDQRRDDSKKAQQQYTDFMVLHGIRQ